MTKYIDIIALESGAFCVAPPWTVTEGDYVGIPNVISGEMEVHEVISVATDAENGDFVKMIEKYIGFQLPRAEKKFHKSTIEWGDDDVHE